ncbi:MAG TPA: RNA-binding cell elongation regulator Jag/EloR [Acidimicrobiales bacterium]|nr:RNA-binding cell elongation regulator Jag/EloR [Acidimicrobiales bacterium]
MEWVVTTGRTIEEATEAALDQLGVDERDAEVEVVQEPQKGLFGRLRSEAQVRARVRPTAPRPKVDRRERRRGDRRRREGGGERAKKGSRERVGAGGASGAGGDAPADDDGSTSEGSTAGAGRSSGGSSSSRRRRRSRASRTAEGAMVSESTQPAEVSPAEEMDLDAQRTAVDEFLRDLMAAFGRDDATVSVTVAEDDEALEATIEGSELGLLVGQKGVTLAAVQELVRSMVQRQFVGQAHARVRVDVAGYRARRKEALERFATGVAESVKESGVAKALDPMGSADRKVVHDVVNDIDGVVTVSEGVDANRRVVIRPE